MMSEDLDNQLDYLIDRLVSEMPDQRCGWQLHSTQQRFDAFRALVNIREPKPIDDEFLNVQDRMLQAVAASKGIVDAAELPPCRIDERLALWQGDITALRADAIVNAANSGMLGCFVPGHHCIDNTIHTYAGVQLRLACDRIMRAQGHPEPTAQAKVTPGFNLPARCIIHTVGPVVHGAPTSEQAAQLAQCYAACLDAAVEAQCRTVAFCCISTGVFGYPQAEAARIAVDAVCAWLDRTGARIHVVFDVFLDSDRDIYEQLLG